MSCFRYLAVSETDIAYLVKPLLMNPSLASGSLKKADMTEEDELRWFASATSEINIAGPPRTAQITNLIALEEVMKAIEVR